MKLIRFGPAGEEKPGILTDEGERVDASAFGEDWNESFLGGDGMSRLGRWAADHLSAAPRVSNSVRLGAPITRPSKIVCIGLNYEDHARESGIPLPKEPVIFFKATSAYCGPYDDLVLPRKSKKTDWEVELAVVVGRTARYVSEKEAGSHVAGYVLHNDYSEREFQLEREGQWVKGKSADTFAPLGPYLVTPDEVGDPQALDLWLTVNGEARQKSNTRNMVFGALSLVSYVSQFMTLLPGDVISTGTPPGVGLGSDPPVYLEEGDVVELGVQGLGEQRQKVIAPR